MLQPKTINASSSLRREISPCLLLNLRSQSCYGALSFGTSPRCRQRHLSERDNVEDSRPHMAGQSFGSGILRAFLAKTASRWFSNKRWVNVQSGRWLRHTSAYHRNRRASTADFVMLAKDPHDVEPDQIKHIPVVPTVVDGKTVHAKS